MGKVTWSRTLQQAMDEIDIWKVVLSRKQGTRVSTRCISRLEKRVSVKNSLRNIIAQTNENLKDACARYYALKKDVDDLRESWLKDLAAIRAKEKGGDQSKIYSALLLRDR